MARCNIRSQYDAGLLHDLGARILISKYYPRFLHWLDSGHQLQKMLVIPHRDSGCPVTHFSSPRQKIIKIMPGLLIKLFKSSEIDRVFYP